MVGVGGGRQPGRVHQESFPGLGFLRTAPESLAIQSCHSRGESLGVLACASGKGQRVATPWAWIGFLMSGFIRLGDFVSNRKFECEC